MKRPIWFKAKRYGWGWYPATWQGWLILLGWFAIFVKGVVGLNLPDDNLVLVFFRVAILTILLIIVLYLFGEKPRWHWGDK